MSINANKPTLSFAKTFGLKEADTHVAKEDRPKAMFWLNLGYTVEVEVNGVPESRFISLPVGIPLDTQEPEKTNSKNKEWAMMQAARNALLEELKGYAAHLEPGAEEIIELQVQLRRVNEEAHIPEGENPFIRKITA